MSSPIPRFCSSCGAALVERVIEAEQRARLVCTQCGTIAYRSPQIVVSTIVAAGERVLLCRRAIAPAIGRWSLPGGFMEAVETLEEAAARETWEETGVRLDPLALRLHALSTLPELNEVYVGFIAEVTEPVSVQCGPECSEAHFFDEASVPWSDVAYPEIAAYLQLYFRERDAATFGIHHNRLDSTGTLRRSYRVAGVEEIRMAREAFLREPIRGPTREPK